MHEVEHSTMSHRTHPTDRDLITRDRREDGLVLSTFLSLFTLVIVASWLLAA